MDSPKRIQLRRAPGWRKPSTAVVVSRPGTWGNPYHIFRDGLGVFVFYRREGEEWLLVECSTMGEARDIAVGEFEIFLTRHPELVDLARVELAGRDLCCWCPLDRACHADVLLRVANSSSGAL